MAIGCLTARNAVRLLVKGIRYFLETADYAAPKRPTYFPSLRFMKDRKRKHCSVRIPKQINLRQHIQIRSVTRAEIIAGDKETDVPIFAK